MTSAYIEFTGLTFCNARVDEVNLPGREITNDMLYHMFASCLFEQVKVNRGFGAPLETYNRSDQSRFVSERDRIEIRKLRAELELLKTGEKKD